jgi:hypothetical protein
MQRGAEIGRCRLAEADICMGRGIWGGVWLCANLYGVWHRRKYWAPAVCCMQNAGALVRVCMYVPMIYSVVVMIHMIQTGVYIHMTYDI